MHTSHAVGIDLGTTFSCISYLNERGEPITLPNEEGELCTPSVVMYEDGEEIVGTEAWRNSIMYPRQVVQNAKRFMGDANKRWTIGSRALSPVDVSAAVLRKLLRDAAGQIGTIERAVITVPAQFSDLQRQATVQAGLQAGLKQVDIINEPVAAALCYVLGKEGLWFTELADEQKILVYDLGGGTFDLSLVRYQQDEVCVIASSGDLHLGGIDWNQSLQNAVADQFTREFQEDPRHEPESLQALAWEVEQCKRSLSTRPRASLICQHAGKRKTYQIEQEQFNQLTAHLVKRSEEITRRMLKDNKLGWAHVNVVLITGGSSRMPMIRNMLQTLSGRTLNTSLSPDQAIAHGAAYYAGMLLTNSEFAKSILNEEATARLSKLKQQSVNARALGILVRDVKTNHRVPHYMIPANTPLPTSITHTFGTVVPNQERVVLRIVESGTSADPYVEIGDCTIDGLPPDLPIDSHVAVTISYDASAKIHVSARDVTSGKQAQTQILRSENVLTRDADEDTEVMLMPVDTPAKATTTLVSSVRPSPPMAASVSVAPVVKPATAKPPVPPPPPVPSAKAVAAKPPVASPVAAKPPVPKPVPPAGQTRAASRLEESAVPIPLCNECGEPLNTRGVCPACGPQKLPAAAKPAAPKPAAAKPAAKPAARSGAAIPTAKPAAKSSAAIPTAKPAAAPGSKPRPAAAAATTPADLSKILELDDDDIFELPAKKAAPSRSAIPVAKPAVTAKPVAKPQPAGPAAAPKPKPGDDDDADFWKLPDE